MKALFLGFFLGAEICPSGPSVHFFNLQICSVLFYAGRLLMSWMLSVECWMLLKRRKKQQQQQKFSSRSWSWSWKIDRQAGREKFDLRSRRRRMMNRADGEKH